MNQEIPENDLKTEIRGGLALVTLNRPDSLNALTLEMIRQLSAALKDWEEDPAISAVFISGAGDRAFCSGGDIKAFYSAGMDYRKGFVDHKVPTLFFGEEYTLNRQLYHYSKPVIAFMNGITMGGGYGIAGNCRHRVVCENTVFAMPEVGIGFFPDVGSVYHLLQCPSHIGRYLALTGNKIKAADMIYAGLADVYIPQADQGAVISALEQGGDIQAILDRHSRELQEDAELPEYEALIEQVFAQATAGEILQALKDEGSVWSRRTLELIRSRSPTSVAVTLRHLNEAEGKEFDTIIHTDFILAQRFIQHGDFYEGIRAAVINREDAPLWNPENFEAVAGEDVNNYFSPTGYDLNEVQIFKA